MKKTIKINGMSCGHCSSAVVNALSAMDGVSDVSVDLQAKLATAEVNGPVSDEMLKEAVEEAGYQVVEIS